MILKYSNGRMVLVSRRKLVNYNEIFILLNDIHYLSRRVLYK